VPLIAGEAALTDRTRARNRLTKFLLRRSERPNEGIRRWTRAYRTWLSSLRFEQPATEIVYADLLAEVEHTSQRLLRLEQAIDRVVENGSPRVSHVVECLQALRGIGKVTATTIVAELGSISRFEHPTKLMGYSGMVPRERSSGARVRQGGITKTGNAHLRRVLVEAAWAISKRPGRRPPIRGTDSTTPPQIREIALAAQHRLHQRYWHLIHRGKTPDKAVVAVARELLGFVWHVGVVAEKAVA